jgi:hypothetical protein
MVYLPPKEVRLLRVGNLLAKVSPIPRREGSSMTAAIMQYDHATVSMKPWYWYVHARDIFAVSNDFLDQGPLWRMARECLPTS